MTKFHPAEVVGYSTEQIGWTKPGQKFNILVNQFRNADGSEARLYMKDIRPNQVWVAFDGGTGFQPGSDSVQLFTPEGQVKIALSYATQDWMDENFYIGENKPGWYPLGECGGGEFDNPQDNEYVPFGNGYVVKAGNGEGVMPTLTFSGEVKKGVTEVPGQVFVFSGNCTPVDIKMKDIQCNQTWEAFGGGTGFQPGSDSVQIFSDEGQVFAPLSYASAGWMEENFYIGENKPGWYPLGDCGGGEFDDPKGDLDVPAGSGFVFKTGSGEGVWPTITIPSAIKE